MNYTDLETKFEEIRELEKLLEFTNAYEGGLLTQTLDTTFKGRQATTERNMRDEFLPISRKEIIETYKTNITNKIIELKSKLEKETNTATTLLDVIEFSENK